MHYTVNITARLNAMLVLSSWSTWFLQLLSCGCHAGEGGTEVERGDETTLQQNMPFFFSSMFMCRILGPIFTAWVKIMLCNIWDILCKLV